MRLNAEQAEFLAMIRDGQELPPRNPRINYIRQTLRTQGLAQFHGQKLGWKITESGMLSLRTYERRLKNA